MNRYIFTISNANSSREVAVDAKSLLDAEDRIDEITQEIAKADGVTMYIDSVWKSYTGDTQTRETN